MDYSTWGERELIEELEARDNIERRMRPVLSRIVEYMFRDEEKDFEECGRPATGHIFEDVQALRVHLADN